MEAATQRDVLWCSTQFVSQPFMGDTVTWEIERLAVGKRSGSAARAGVGNDQTAFVAIGSTGIAIDDGLTGQYVPMPAVGAPDDSAAHMSNLPGEPTATAGPSTSRCGWRSCGATSAHRRVFWAQRRDRGALTPAVLAFIADMVPVAVARAAGKMGAGSSLDNSMRFHGGVADTDWVLIELHGELANGGFGHGSLRVDGRGQAHRHRQPDGIDALPVRHRRAAEPAVAATGARSGLETWAMLDPELFLPEASRTRRERRRHDHLGRRPPRRATRHVRGAAAAAPPGPGAADRRERPGHEVWEFDGQQHTQVGMNAVVGRRPETVQREPFRFDQMRPGCFDVDARVHDMDINGVWASLSFPSMITGFCGRVYSQCSDPELGLATTRAFNDWVHEAWWRPHRERIIPLGITWLSDPEIGAAEIRRNAERGFRAVTLPERPHQIGYPSIFDEHWAPILEACADTGTVVCLHVGSSGMGEIPPGCDRAIMPLVATLFSQLSLQACTEWLWAGWTVRYPELKVAMAEGGIGWVAMLLDRLDNLVDRSRLRAGLGRAPGRGAAAQLLVLHHRRPVDHRHPPRHRDRPHHGGGRLPPRRQHLARHPGRHRARPGATSRPPSAASSAARTPPPCSATRCPTSSCPSGSPFMAMPVRVRPRTSD